VLKMFDSIAIDPSANSVPNSARSGLSPSRPRNRRTNLALKQLYTPAEVHDLFHPV
jgi:hypothetical protein